MNKKVTYFKKIDGQVIELVETDIAPLRDNIPEEQIRLAYAVTYDDAVTLLESNKHAVWKEIVIVIQSLVRMGCKVTLPMLQFCFPIDYELLYEMHCSGKLNTVV